MALLPPLVRQLIFFNHVNCLSKYQEVIFCWSQLWCWIYYQRYLRVSVVRQVKCWGWIEEPGTGWENPFSGVLAQVEVGPSAGWKSPSTSDMNHVHCTCVMLHTAGRKAVWGWTFCYLQCAHTPVERPCLKLYQWFLLLFHGQWWGPCKWGKSGAQCNYTGYISFMPAFRLGHRAKRVFWQSHYFSAHCISLLKGQNGILSWMMQTFWVGIIES